MKESGRCGKMRLAEGGNQGSMWDNNEGKVSMIPQNKWLWVFIIIVGFMMVSCDRDKRQLKDERQLKLKNKSASSKYVDVIILTFFLLFIPMRCL